MKKFEGRGFFHDPVSRRDVIKAGALVGLGASVGLSFGPAKAADDNVLGLLSWPGHAGPEVVGEFEKKYNVKVQAKEYTGGEEMMALLQSSPPGTFDVVLTDAEYVTMLAQAGKIDALDPAQYPLNDFWPQFQKFPLHWREGKLYSLINSFGYLGLVYNTTKLSADDARSYKLLWDGRVTKKVGMYDWYLPNMSCLSMYDGNRPPYDVDKAKFEQLSQALLSLSPQMSGIGPWSSVFSSLTNGEAWVMPGVGAWAAILLQKSGVPITAAIPQEGGVQWTESLSIVSSSAKKDLAVKFLQYRASPEGQVQTATKSSYVASMPSKAGWELLDKTDPKMADLLEHRLDKRNVMSEIEEGKIEIRGLPTQQSIEEWTDVWTRFKNA
ncbi:ABC transporter substrate-binding protein [Labrys wisconsinensis]|uniref:Spermidine/putrescine transport system substrate-binding protein n=1 Tax=Labrys wisconsinensis TaxID=425677 RepID=A0ABU0J6T2_9HYPH|nr:spermidine/putrescine ABC transporter substrate-binding protein [Labrys wisconsinensis]MDQ0469168.1 spermidine/putrescine transport system substrate-binding protein [Labrys wisconsinensis]